MQPRDLVWDGCLNVRDLGGLPVASGGATAFQSVLHYHLHLIPRWTRDGKGFDWKLVPGDRTQIMAIGQKIRDAVEARR